MPTEDSARERSVFLLTSPAKDKVLSSAVELSISSSLLVSWDPGLSRDRQPVMLPLQKQQHVKINVAS